MPLSKKRPVILITYNRPDHTAKVLEALRIQRIDNLIIHIDAPKSPDQFNNNDKVRNLVKGITWTSPLIWEAQSNRGLAGSILFSVNKAFEEYEEVVLLEDDCIPNRYFFDFTNLCLDKYKDYPEVFGISGYTVPIELQHLEDYRYDAYFYPRIGSWGWATWKEKWIKKENDLKRLVKEINDNHINPNQGGSDVPDMINEYFKGNLKDVWTFEWLLSVYLQRGCYVYPVKSTIENIGMDGTGIHVGKTNKYQTEITKNPLVKLPPKVTFEENIYWNVRKFYDPSPILKTPFKKTKNPRVVILSSQDHGGAGIAAYRLHRGLRESGVDSKMFTLSGSRDDPTVEVLLNEPEKESSPFTIRHSDYYKFWEITSGLKDYFPDRSEEAELFTSSLSIADLSAVSAIKDADIIHLHWVAGMLNYENISRVFKDKIIVWTLHDMNPFTGGCHHSDDCVKFRNKCGSCPALGSDDERDISAKIHQIKELVYNDLDITVVTPSNWLKSESKTSSLFKSNYHDTIPNGFPDNIFKRLNKNELREKLGIPREEKILLFGADSVNNPRKGFSYLNSAINSNCLKSDKFSLMVFGNNNGINLNREIKIYNAGVVSNEADLAVIYNVADLFVLPTLADNLPNTVAESLLCGTPVAAFNVGGLADMIIHKRNGYLARFKDSDDLAEGIHWLLNHNNPDELSEYTRSQAESKFALKVQAETYIKLYEKLIDRKNNIADGENRRQFENSLMTIEDFFI